MSSVVAPHHSQNIALEPLYQTGILPIFIRFANNIRIIIGKLIVVPHSLIVEND
jgi:hypothetical protein